MTGNTPTNIVHNNNINSYLCNRALNHLFWGKLFNIKATNFLLNNIFCMKFDNIYNYIFSSNSSFLTSYTCMIIKCYQWQYCVFFTSIKFKKYIMGVCVNNMKQFYAIKKKTKCVWHKNKRRDCICKREIHKFFFLICFNNFLLFIRRLD